MLHVHYQQVMSILSLIVNKMLILIVAFEHNCAYV